MPGIGLIVEGPDPEEAFMPIPLGRSFQKTPKLNLGHALLENLSCFLVDFFPDLCSRPHQFNLKRGFDLTRLSEN